MSVIVYPISTLIFTVQLKGKAVTTVSPWRPINLNYQRWTSTLLPAPEKPPELIQRGCSGEELRMRQEGRQRHSSHGRIQGQNFTPFGFIECKRRGSSWTKSLLWDASTVGLNHIPLLKRESNWQGKSSAKGGEIFKWQPLCGSSPSILGRQMGPSARHEVWGAEGLCWGNDLACSEVSQGDIVIGPGSPAHAQGQQAGHQGVNEKQRQLCPPLPLKSGVSSHRPFSPGAKTDMDPSGTWNSFSDPVKMGNF